MSFFSFKTYPAVAGPAAAIAADFNGDGRPDLAVVGSGGLSVSLGVGDGTFQPARTFDPGVSLTAEQASDINGDGVVDLVALAPGSGGASGTVSVLLGNGDGTFQPPRNYPVGVNPTSLVVADFNGDGKLDLAVANAGSGTVSILLGNGDGTFQTPPSISAGSDPTDLAVADVNGDHKPDLIEVNPGFNGGTPGVDLLLGNGDGTFRAPAVVGSSQSPDAVAVADVNGDGKLDLVVGNSSFAFGVDVYLGNGDGTFQAALHVDNSGYGVSALTVADLNGDGKPDVVLTNSFYRYPGQTSALRILQGNGDGTFAPASFFTPAAPNSPAGAVAVDDFNGDGRPDLAVADNGNPKLVPPNAPGVDEFLNQSPLHFTLADYVVPEVAGSATITVVPTVSLTNAVTVHYSATAGTAVPGTDFTPVDGDLTFNPGDTSQTFTVPILAGSTGTSSPNPTINLTLTFNSSAGDQSNSVLTLARASDDAAFVAGLFHDLLGRAPDPQGLAAFTAPLDAVEVPLRGQVAAQFLASSEYYTVLVNGYYKHFFQVPAPSADLSYWDARLAAGLTDQQVIADLVGSQWYLTVHQGSQSDPNLAFLDAVYPDLLGRPLDPAGQAYWLPQLQNGTTRTTVALGILASAEYQGNLLQGYYLALLGRAPGAGDRTFWLGQFQQGLTDEQVQAGIVASDEAFRHFSGTNQGWLNGLYLTLLQRPPDLAGDTSYLNLLLGGQAAQRQSTAEVVLTSAEYRNDLVSAFYQKYLGRAAGGQDLAYWGGLLQGGASDEDVRAGILGSQEYLNRNLGGNPDPNLAFLSAAFRDLLGRAPGPADQAFWLPLLQNGASRASVAQEILSSTEYRDGLVSGWVTTFLGRPATAADLAFAVNLLQDGEADEQVLAGLLASAEYFQRPHLYP